MNIKMLTAAAAITACLAAGAQPRPFFPATTHHFGAINEEDGPAECKFAMVNMGTSPLTVVSARATCGCTTPEYPRKSIAPGDTAYISVAYDPAGRPGRFSKAIYVETNGTPAKTRLDITGVVIGDEATVSRRYPADFGPLKMSKKAYSLGDATMGRLKTVYLEGYNRSADSLHIKVGNLPPYLDVTVAPEVAPPGEQVTLIAYVAPHKGAQYGLSEDTVSVSPAPGLHYPLPLIVNVKEDFSNLGPEQMHKSPIAVPSTDRIDLGVIDRDAEPVNVVMHLQNAGKSDLKIRRIYSVDKGITALTPTPTVKKGKSVAVTVTVDPSRFDGAILNGRLQIITNDPLYPVYTVRIVGQWDEN